MYASFPKYVCLSVCVCMFLAACVYVSAVQITQFSDSLLMILSLQNVFSTRLGLHWLSNLLLCEYLNEYSVKLSSFGICRCQFNVHYWLILLAVDDVISNISNWFTKIKSQLICAVLSAQVLMYARKYEYLHIVCCDCLINKISQIAFQFVYLPFYVVVFISGHSVVMWLACHRFWKIFVRLCDFRCF